MKLRGLSKIITAASTLLLSATTLFAADTIKFTAIPDQDTARLEQRFGKIADYLTKEVGINFDYIPGTGNPSDPDQIVGQQLIWENVGPLAAGDSVQITFQAVVVAQVSGTFNNVVLVSAESPVGPITGIAPAASTSRALVP